MSIHLFRRRFRLVSRRRFLGVRHGHLSFLNRTQPERDSLRRKYLVHRPIYFTHLRSHIFGSPLPECHRALGEQTSPLYQNNKQAPTDVPPARPTALNSQRGRSRYIHTSSVFISSRTRSIRRRVSFATKTIRRTVGFKAGNDHYQVPLARILS